ncbi:MAG TPA: SCO family protein, partial [Pirellulaceae bacterium]
MMNSRALMAWIGILFLFAGTMTIGFATGLWSQDPTRGGDPQVSEEPDPGETSTRKKPALAEFQLTDQEGNAFHSKSLDGKIWVGSIFFADCPSVCRTQNQRIAELQSEFGAQGVELVSITCDPKHDTSA